MLLRLQLPIFSAIIAVALTACTPPPESDSATVAAGFYPLEFIVAEVAGDHVQVLPLSNPGVSAHDAELSPKVVRQLNQADALVYVEQMQPAVDDAVQNLPESLRKVNLADFIELRPLGESGTQQQEFDPHFWLNPLLYAQAVSAVATELSAELPAHAAEFEQNAKALVARLTDLHSAYSAGLQQCERRTIVVSHEAFGYLTAEFGLTQVGMSGVNPEAEPAPARLREIRTIVEEFGIDTIFFETAVSSEVTETFAADLGVSAAVLDPVESLVTDSDDYFSVMERNLAALQKALSCVSN